MKQESMVGVPGQEAVTIATPEGRMAVEIRGPGASAPTVVCLHGLSAHRATWRPVARLLEHRFRFVLIDLLGRGQSDPSQAASFDLDSETTRLCCILDALDVTRPFLAGHSHGASIAVAAARRVDAAGLLLVNPVTPDLSRPAALTLLRGPLARSCVAPVLRLFRQPLTRYMLVRRVFADGDEVSAGLVAQYADPWRSPARTAGLARILSDWDPAELDAWATPPGMPVRVVAGDMDRRIDPEAARRWTARLGGHFNLAAGCGHSAPEERTTEVASDLEDLVTTIDHGKREETQHDQE